MKEEPKAKSEDEYIGVNECAGLFKVSPRTIRRYVESGLIPCIRIGPQILRFHKATMHKKLSQNLTPPP